MRKERYFFSTRDWLMMAALAALGGVAGTYINAIGDVMQSILGVAGTTQWAAGLHVVWLTLAVGLTGRVGAGTLTGILKGVVEVLTGNTHGVIVLLVNVVAGLLVDAVFLPFRRKDRLGAFLLAGGIASASNVFVFQLFAALPTDVLAYGAMLLVGGVAMASGVVFAGGVGWLLLGALRRAGVVKDQSAPPPSGRLTPVMLGAAAVLAVLFAIYLRGVLRGPATIGVEGAVTAPFSYPQEHGDIEEITAQAAQGGNEGGGMTRYTGVPVREVLDRAEPATDDGWLLVRASDGYTFFIDLEEVRDNPALLLAPVGSGQDGGYDLVGAANRKAWVRGVSELVVIARATLEIEGRLAQPGSYDPNDWQFDMDSTTVDVGAGPQKLQGTPLGRVLASMSPLDDAAEVVARTPDGEVTLSLADVLADDDVRLFTAFGDEGEGSSFAIARMNGAVLATHVTSLEVR